jgi:hypothetical protein
LITCKLGLGKKIFYFLLPVPNFKALRSYAEENKAVMGLGEGKISFSHQYAPWPAITRPEAAASKAARDKRLFILSFRIAQNKNFGSE